MMTMTERQTFTTFCGERRISAGDLAGMMPEVRAWVAKNGDASLLYFDDLTGKQVDFNLHDEIPAPRVGPGRPKLGVVSREISLLPRHWEWLEKQPNGASAAMRRLVDAARHQPHEREQRAREAAGRFLTAMAGNYPHYEEATRFLYAGELERMESLISEWPEDVRTYALRLARHED